MSVSNFPEHKSIERFIRKLDEQGAELVAIAQKLNSQIDDWHEAYVRLGKEYIDAGGTDPEILDKVFAITKAKELFGAYII